MGSCSARSCLPGHSEMAAPAEPSAPSGSPEEVRAATKMQAMHRGNSDRRKSVAVAEERALDEAVTFNEVQCMQKEQDARQKLLSEERRLAKEKREEHERREAAEGEISAKAAQAEALRGG